MTRRDRTDTNTPTGAPEPDFSSRLQDIIDTQEAGKPVDDWDRHGDPWGGVGYLFDSYELEEALLANGDALLPTLVFNWHHPTYGDSCRRLLAQLERTPAVEHALRALLEAPDKPDRQWARNQLGIPETEPDVPLRPPRAVQPALPPKSAKPPPARLDRNDLSGHKSWLVHRDGIGRLERKDLCFRQLQLVGARLVASEFVRCTFDECNFGGTGFAEASLTGCGFTSCFMEMAGFEAANLVDTTFDGARLVTADFQKVYMRNCTFFGLSLARTMWQGAKVRYSTFDSVCLDLVRFDDAVFSRCTFRGCTFSESDFAGVYFMRCDLTGADFTGANLADARFLECVGAPR